MTRSKVASKSELLKLAQRKYLEVELPGFPQPFRIQSLTGRELTRFAHIFKAGLDEFEAVGALVALCLVDESGQRMFSDDEIDEVNNLDSSVTIPLANAIQAHCKLFEELIENDDSEACRTMSVSGNHKGRKRATK